MISSANTTTQAKLTKQQLIANINALASEKTGFKTELSIKSLSKDRLEAMFSEYQTMFVFKSLADDVKSQYSEEEWNCAILFPNSCSNSSLLKDIKKYDDLCKKVDYIWFKKF